jgi:hypothetical protein
MNYTQEQVAAVQDKAYDIVSKIANVNGIGITLLDFSDETSSHALKINLVEQASNLPTDIDGVPVVYEVIGEIELYDLEDEGEMLKRAALQWNDFNEKHGSFADQFSTLNTPKDNEE